MTAHDHSSDMSRRLARTNTKEIICSPLLGSVTPPIEGRALDSLPPSPSVILFLVLSDRNQMDTIHLIGLGSAHRL